jgi:hypothetical protein
LRSSHAKRGRGRRASLEGPLISLGAQLAASLIHEKKRQCGDAIRTSPTGSCSSMYCYCRAKRCC